MEDDDDNGDQFDGKVIRVHDDSNCSNDDDNIDDNDADHSEDNGSVGNGGSNV